MAVLGVRSLTPQIITNASTNDFYGDTSTLNSSQVTIDVAKDGSVKVDKKSVRNHVIPLKETDQLRLVIFDKPANGVYSPQIIINLPKEVNASNVSIIPRLVHNSSPEVISTPINEHLITLSTDYIDPQANMSVEINFPKGTLDLPVTTRVLGSLTNQSILWWTGIALLLPIITLILLSIIIIRKLIFTRKTHTDTVIEDLPSAIPPAVAEVLLNSRITPRSIAATLVDLAKRGYIIIGFHENDFRFGKHKAFGLPSQQTLNSLKENDTHAILQAVSQIKDNTDIAYFERLLLSKIFTNESFTVGQEEIKDRIGHRLFSDKMAEFYAEVYKIATSQNFFIENPAAYHGKYKNLGLLLFFGGLLGFFVGMVKFPEPKTMLLFWIGMMLTAFVIIRESSRLPILSTTGIEDYKKWRAFKKFLSDPSLIDFTGAEDVRFEKFMPYAIALGVEKEWTARFREHPFLEPVWFNSEKGILSLEDFDRELFPLISWVGENLSLARTPTID